MTLLAEFTRYLLTYASIVVFTMLVLQSLLYLAQLLLAFREFRRHKIREQQTDTWWVLKSDVTLPISLLVPAYNEQATIVENIHSLLSLHYPDFEVIVINDGSTDHTLQAVIDALDLKPVDRVHELSVPHKTIRGIYGNPNYPRLLLVDKENGGKSDALNAGINLSRCPLFCAVDADSVLDPDALLQVVRPFIEAPDEMIAVGGRIRIVNGCDVRAGRVVAHGIPKRIIPLFQCVEYIRAFLMARLAWSRLDAMLIISGAFGLFKRSAAVEVGGYSHHTVGEDMEIVVKLHRHYRETNRAYQMRYVPDPVCWTEAPATLSVLRRQRTRWQRGLMESLTKHKRMIFSPRYGTAGTLGMGNHVVFDVVGPVVEVVGYLLIPLCWVTGLLSTQFFVAFLFLMICFGAFISVASLFLEEMSLNNETRARDLAILTLAAIAENFGYRQLNSLWRIQGIWQFFRKEQAWGSMPRTGFRPAEKKV